MGKIIIDWLKKNLVFILFGIFIFCIVACFISGCNYHKNHFKCPEITNDTIILHDPYWHHIADSLMNLSPKEKIKWQPQDTFFTPPDTFFKDVDTIAILKNHFSTFRYHWYKKDSGKLELNLYTTVSQNMPIKYELDYNILQPLTIINQNQDNSIHYSQYIYLGFDLPFYKMENAEITALYAFRKGFVGGGYAPLAKGISLKTGINLFKWK